MITLDTNVLVRIVTRDDPDQLAAAIKIMQSESLWITKTVLLELEWVLRYSYTLSREVIAETLITLLGLRTLQVEDRPTVVQAHSWYVRGMDFADALHLASSTEARLFATFDRKLASRAAGIDETPMIDLLYGA